jgi:hypothetical protein
MQGEEADEVELGPGGVFGDRAYGFLDDETDRLVSAKRPKRFGTLRDCRARFVAAPSADAPTPPIVVTFPNGTVVRGDGTDSAELTRIGLKQIEPLGQFAWAGSYAEVVTPGVVRHGDQVRIERVEPRDGVLAATIDTIAAALAAGP